MLQVNELRLRDANELLTHSQALLPLLCFLRAGEIPSADRVISNTNDRMYHPCLLSVIHRVNMAPAAERNNAVCSQLLFFGYAIAGAQHKGSDVIAIGLMCE